MKGLRLLCILILGLSFVVSCAKKERKVIKIGLALPLTGDCAQFGDMIRKGAWLKVRQVNEAGGINGERIELVEEDDAANPQEAASVAQKMCADKDILIVVGHFNSSCSLAGKPIYREAGLVELSPASTNPEVCKDSPWTFRNIYEDTFQGKSLANYVKDRLKLKRIAVIYDNDDYGIGLKDAFTEEGKRIGLEIVGTESYERDTTDFSPQLIKFKELKPEAIFMSGLYTQGAMIAAQSRELGMTTQLLGADGILSSDYIKIGGKSVEGTILTCPFLFELGGEETKEFVKVFIEKYGVEPDCWAALTYDAVGIATEAIKHAGKDRAAIRDYLAEMTTKEKGYEGITGMTFFDENGDCKKPIHVAQVRNGRFVPAPLQIMPIK
ncbi:MAG: ABC transporter substrate-binding protein [bacterium]|nr:ABC transporter substrate-binding protein [bacterium]